MKEGIQVRVRGRGEVSICQSHHLDDLQTCILKLSHQ